MVTLVVIVLLVVAVIAVFARKRAAARERELADAKAEARRWTERLGGQVLSLVGTDTATKQALADAAERYTAAGSQMEQATTARQASLAMKTALEGLYYVRAARLAMGLDPGPDLPADPDAQRAGQVEEHRSVSVGGQDYEASPRPGENTPHYYPGGRVAGRPVPQGWYSEPWWQPALIGGAWGIGSFLLFDAMFGGMSGIPSAQSWEQGYDAGQADAIDNGDNGGDSGGDGGGDGGDQGGDFGGDAGADWGGGDWGGGGNDWGGGGFDF